MREEPGGILQGGDPSHLNYQPKGSKWLKPEAILRFHDRETTTMECVRFFARSSKGLSLQKPTVSDWTAEFILRAR
jgi:hypothetical protein